MAFKISDAMRIGAETWKAEFLSHVGIAVKELHDKGEPITLEVYRTLTLNSWEHKYLLPLLDNNAFLWAFHQALSFTHRKNTEWSVPSVVYDDFILQEGVDELAERFVILGNKYQALVAEHCQYDDKEKI